MKLQWMGDYREMVEKLIKYCNVYAAVYNREMDHGADIAFSFSQIQVVEYLLENEDLHQNMSEIASRLGITLSTFSKLVNHLAEKGFLEKFHTTENHKAVIVRVTDYGLEVYSKYVEYILNDHFAKMFQVADTIPNEDIPKFAAMLEAGIQQQETSVCKRPTVLVPIENKAL